MPPITIVHRGTEFVGLGPGLGSVKGKSADRSTDARGHRKMLSAHDRKQEFNRPYIGVIIGMGLRTFALPGDAGHGAWEGIRVCHVKPPERWLRRWRAPGLTRPALPISGPLARWLVGALVW